VVGGLRTLRRLQLGDQLLDLLRACPRHNHHCVRRRHHDEILDPDERRQPSVRVHDAIGCVHGDDRALQHIALRVARRDVEQGIPAADVGPAEVAGDDGGAVGLFHHRIVD